MKIKQKLQEFAQKLLGLQNINEFIEKNERRIMDLELDCDNFEDKFSDFDDKIEELERNEILSYDADDFVKSDDNNFVETEDLEQLELLVNRLAKAVKVLASKTDLEFRIDSILEGTEDKIERNGNETSNTEIKG